MLLSILTPSLNQAQFLPVALDSILRQIEGFECEILVSDGGSADATQRVLADYAARFSGIRWWSSPDAGPADALNKALAQARGDIVGWLNADDFYLPGALRAVLDVFRRQPSWQMVYGIGHWVDENGAFMGVYPSSPPTVPIDRFQRGCFISQPTVFMRRSLMNRVGPFCTDFRSAFDLEYWLRVFSIEQDRIGFIDHPLAATRLHGATITRQQRERGALEAMQALHQHLGYVQDNWARAYLNELQTEETDPRIRTDKARGFLGKAAQWLPPTDIDRLHQMFCGADRLDTSTRLTTHGPTPPLPWLARLIYAARVDLRKKFDLTTSQGYLSYCLWLLRSAVGTNRQLCRDPEFLAFCRTMNWPGTDLDLVEATVYQSDPAMPSRFPLDTHTAQFKAWVQSGAAESVLQLYAPLLQALANLPAVQQPAWQQRWQTNANTASQYSYGVNVIGYAQTASGIGEDARTTFDDFKRRGIPCSLVDFKPGDPLPQTVRTHDSHLVPVGPYSINLVCLPATELVRYVVTEGAPQMLGRYNIGYWPWELDAWPSAWQPIDELVDEVWVASRFIKQSIGGSVRKPVKVVPLKVELGPVSPLTRADFGLPEHAKLFCFSFDLNSSIDRKNPQDCITLFLQSFPQGQGWTREQVGLVIKTHRPVSPVPQWEALKALAAQDDRIHIVEQSFSRPDLLALYNVCDCFLSLHRAEGFGRNIAEAILLGLEVVTTGYSGNLDFCHPPQCTLVECELVPVKAGQYPDGDGMHWAGNFKLPKLDAVRRRFSPTPA